MTLLLELYLSTTKPNRRGCPLQKKVIHLFFCMPNFKVLTRSISYSCCLCNCLLQRSSSPAPCVHWSVAAASSCRSMLSCICRSNAQLKVYFLSLQICNFALIYSTLTYITLTFVMRSMNISQVARTSSTNFEMVTRRYSLFHEMKSLY